MFSNDDELKDWEIREEEVPKPLQRKWDEESKFDPQTVLCRSCQKPIPSDSLTCLFCGASVFASGNPKPQGGFWSWIQKWFSRKS